MSKWMFQRLLIDSNQIFDTPLKIAFQYKNFQFADTQGRATNVLIHDVYELI